MQVHFKAVSKAGKIYEKTVEVKSKEELYQKIKQRGDTLVSAETVEENEKRGSLGWFNKLQTRVATVAEEDKIVFARNLGAMIGAGLAIGRALNVLERQTKNKKFKKIINEISAHIEGGKPLSSGLEQYSKVFPPLFVSMVRAGEESGKLVESLKVISNQLERAHKLKKKIRGAMLYPAIIVFAIIVIAILMLIYVVPTLTATFEELGADLPVTTRFVIGISTFLQNNTFLALGAILAVIVGFVAALRTKRGKRTADFVFIRIPIIGNLVKEVNAGRTTGTMSSLLSSGVEMVRSIEITRDVVQNTYYREVLDEVGEVVKKGGVMSEVFKKHEKLYPPLVSEMVAVGEETGQLSALLDQVAVFYDEEVQQKTKDMSTIIEPFLMVIIGVVVGFFAISMISPMYSLTSSF